jgi:DNA-binding response OmpR family regulator
MFWRSKETLATININLPPDEVRKRARILVVDDDEHAFPYKLLQKEGYNVQYWPKIENLRDLESAEYDLIVLDIYGVATKDVSTSDGLGVLEHIKRVNPAQLVIAYSGQKYDLSQASFWKLADDYLGKPSSLIDCKEKIDLLLRKSFTPAHYWHAIADALAGAGVPQKHIRGFESLVVKSVRKGSLPKTDVIERSLAIAHHTAAFVYAMVAIIARFYTHQ